NLLGHNPESGEGGGERTANRGKSRTPTLDSFGRDLTELARQGQLAPTHGRGNEIARLLLVLGCASANNPVLVGPTGVGKRALVRQWARLPLPMDGPTPVRERRLIEVRLAQLILQAEDRASQFAEMTRAAANEARRAN